MLNHPNDRIGAEVLSFLSVFMYDGNKVVQVMLSLICAYGYLLQIWQQCSGLPLRNFLKTQCDCIRQTSTVCDTIWLEILAVQTIGYSPPNRQGICWQSIYLAMWNLDYDFILNINFHTYRIEAKDIP